MNRLVLRSAFIGTTAAVSLFAFFLVVVAVAEGREGIPDQLRDNGPFFVVLFPAFGTQIGLFAHLRGVLAARKAAASAFAGANGGVSGVAVVACCAHFVPTLLPVVGASAVATLLTAWKTPLLVLAILSNLAGIAYVGRHLRRVLHGPHAAPAAETDPVCGMPTDPSWTRSASFQGRTYRFCSDACQSRFLASPSDYGTVTTALPHAP